MAVQRVFTEALLLMGTAVHLRPRQVAGRLRHGARRRLRAFRVSPAPRDVPEFDPACLERLRALLERWVRLAPPEGARLEGPRRGRFTFGGETVESTGLPPWHAAEASRLWRHEIQYGVFLRDLALACLRESDEAERRRVLTWIHDWIGSNPPGPGAAWAAYPTAARLMNWALAESVFRFNDPAMRNSFARQVRHLSANLEWHLDGNHLLQNAAGLVVADALLGDTPATRSVPVLRHAVGDQVLRDGGHVERCPMYHARVMVDLLVARAASPETVFLDATLDRMAGFLRRILHDDGDIPQFGDSALGEYPAPLALVELVRGARDMQKQGLNQAERGTSRCAPAKVPSSDREDGAVRLPASGFYVMASEERSARVIVKASPPGPAWQPGHAHSDALSYEFSFQGARVIVDSGVHGYDGSPLRDYCRSTAAHNTVQVGGVEQMRFWKTFRVAQRYVIENSGLEETPEGLHFSGSLRVPFRYRHCRDIRMPGTPGEGIFSVRDHLSGGIGGHALRSFIHLHPSWRAAVEGDAATARHGKRALRFVAEGEGLAW